MRQRLTDHFPVDVTRVLGVHELVVIALGFQHARKALVRHHPIAPLGRGGFCAYIVFRNMHPDAERLHGRIGKEMFRVLVSSVRRLGTLAQIDESAGIGQHAMVTLRAEPGHGERHRSAGTAAVSHAAFGVRS